MNFNTAILFINLLCCTPPLPAQPGFKQGITGHVYLQEGNRMPMKGKASRKTGKAVECDIYIYAPLKLSEVVHKGAVIQAESVNPVKVVPTDSTGYYIVDLPEGNYSVVVKWRQQFYVDRVNSQDYIGLVEVSKNHLVNRDFVVRLNTSY